MRLALLIGRRCAQRACQSHSATRENIIARDPEAKLCHSYPLFFQIVASALAGRSLLQESNNTVVLKENNITNIEDEIQNLEDGSVPFWLWKN